MYVYNYRIHDQYDAPVASLAVLADDEPGWRPKRFRQLLFGCSAILQFPTVKLLDFAAREAELESSKNPFAVIVQAHLKALQLRSDERGRYSSKVDLVRRLYERGFATDDVRKLFRFIDWVLMVPKASRTVFWKEVHSGRKEQAMPYVSSFEGYKEWLLVKAKVEVALELVFGDAGLQLMPQIEEIYDEDDLKVILNALKAHTALEEVRKLIDAGVAASAQWKPSETRHG